MKNKYLVPIIDFLIIIIFITIWEIFSQTGVINTFIFSSPSRIISTLKDLLLHGKLLMHIFVTLKEVVISFVLGTILAFIISIILYSNRLLAKIFDPFLTMLNSLPKVSLGPLIIIWAGANTKSIILMAILTNVIISIITIYHGFINTDILKIKLFKVFKASKKQILFKLVIPSNISTIINSLKINISLTLIGVIMGELLVSKKGIGYLILYGTQVFNLDIVMSGLLVLIIISYILYKLVLILNKKIVSD